MHERGVAAESGLYFVGLDFMYAATSDVGGVGRDARYVANHARAPGHDGRPACTVAGTDQEARMALARVVTFDGVSSQRIDDMKREMEGTERPEGLPATEVIVLHDPEAERSLALVFFATEEDYALGDATLNAMPAGDTPGARSSVAKYDVRDQADGLDGDTVRITEVSDERQAELARCTPRRPRAARQRYSGARAPRDPRIGINAYAPSEDGTLIHEHDEAWSGQEELYIVLDGKATFEVDGETVDAPSGTFVFVGPGSHRKATGDGTVVAIGATPGEPYQGVDWGDAWPLHSESMRAYGEQRYADALEAVRGALEHLPTTPACITTTRASQRSGRHQRRHVRPPQALRRAAPAVP